MLFLTLNTFSSTGGIQKVCRAMSHALHAIANDNPCIRFNMYALNDDKIADTKYLRQQEFRGFSGSKIRFVLKAVAKGLTSNIIILSHVNLLLVALIIRIFSKKPQIIMMAHGLEVWRGIPLWKRNFLNKHVIIWAVSSYTAAQLKSHQISSDQVRILHNCIDPFFKISSEFMKHERLLKRYKLSPTQPVLLTMARLTKFDADKGYDKVLPVIPQLLSEFPDLRYFICGQCDSKEKNRLVQLINKHNLQKNVVLVSFIAEAELEAHYHLADIFVLPSKKEGFGLVFIEAALCGCKVISGNKDGSTDAMLNGELGIMIDPDNAEQLKQALLRSLRAQFNLQEAKDIQSLCSDHFSHKRYVDNIKKLLTQHG